jgi:hypothetical protein
MQDGSWIKLADGKYCNLQQIAFVEETDDATLLYAGGAGPPTQTELFRVTDQDTRRPIHSFVESHGAKQLMTTSSGGPRY